MKHQTTVYIVEDELLIAANLKDQLSQAGIVVLGMKSRGEDALSEMARLREEHNEPEIVLMDVNLRGSMDGIDTAYKLSGVSESAIIFLSGQSSREIYERSFPLKPLGYVLKPYDLEQMIMTIEIAAYQRNLKRENRDIRITLEKLLTEKTREQHEARELYEVIMNNTFLGVWIFHNNQVVFSNNMMSQITGYSTEEILGFSENQLQELVYPGDFSRQANSRVEQLKGKNIFQDIEFRITRKTGEIRWVKTNGSLIQFMEKPAFFQIYLDITEYKNKND